MWVVLYDICLHVAVLCGPCLDRGAVVYTLCVHIALLCCDFVAVVVGVGMWGGGGGTMSYREVVYAMWQLSCIDVVSYKCVCSVL